MEHRCLLSPKRYAQPQTEMEATSTTATARTRSAALDYAAVAAFLFGAVLVGWVAADDGGWWPETWAWTAFATLAASIFVALLLDRPLGRLDLVFLGGLVGLGAWTAISALWSPSVPSTLDEAYRVLAYVGTALLALLVIERRTVPHVLGGVLTAIATLGTYALATRLLPDRIGEFNSSAGGYRLSEPVTYWNGLAIFLVVGILLALGFSRPRESAVDESPRGGDLARPHVGPLLHVQPWSLDRAHPRRSRGRCDRSPTSCSCSRSRWRSRRSRSLPSGSRRAPTA